jgi:predicted nucleotide-binding protein
MYFLVTGAVAIMVKGTEVAMRHAGCHVGEMSALESAQPRAATALLKTRRLLSRSAVRIFSRLARRIPALRNALMTAPNEHPKLFIISSLEALPIAREIASGLQHDVLPTVWTDGVFFASGYPLEVLDYRLAFIDFVIVKSRRVI